MIFLKLYKPVVVCVCMFFSVSVVVQAYHYEYDTFYRIKEMKECQSRMCGTVCYILYGGKMPSMI